MATAMQLKTTRAKKATTKIMQVVQEEAIDNPNETDAQIVERMRERFSILDDMTQASIDGVVRGMVVTGPPGVGKSFGVEAVLEKDSLFDVMAENKLRYSVIKGASSAIGLYKVLYNNADKNSVLVLDDCDTVLYDETSLNLLKAALDSSKKRKLSWNTDSALLRREGIPDTFEFKGSVIFITNLKFDKVRGKIKDHLDAIMSRCHYLDLTMDTTREKVLRCKQIVADGMLNEYDFTKVEETQLMDFMINNKDRMREISLRMVTKLADLKKSMGSKWMRTAEVTCMKRK
ncbi:AAA family ATPase [bacterium]|nr:AAA family ATPase [bacterium]MDB4128738.1 AAA family ATPase [bacterium]MDC1257227.1 AAA family ATPase [bacterium]